MFFFYLQFCFFQNRKWPTSLFQSTSSCTSFHFLPIALNWIHGSFCVREGFTFDIVHWWYKLLPLISLSFNWNLKKKDSTPLHLDGGHETSFSIIPITIFFSLYCLVVFFDCFPKIVATEKSFIIFWLLSKSSSVSMLSGWWLCFSLFYISARLYSLYPQKFIHTQAH